MILRRPAASSLPAADIHEGTHHGPHHIAQKAVGSYLEVPVRGIDAVPRGATHVADIGLDIGMQLAERCEILTPEAEMFVSRMSFRALMS